MSGSHYFRCLALLPTFLFFAGTFAFLPGLVFDRFITIWLENQNAAQVFENSDFKNLTRDGLSLTNYYGLTHPSQPNYIASVGGDYFGLDSDGVVSIPPIVLSLVDLLDTKSIDWKEYMEDIPGPGFLGEGGSPANSKSGWLYVRKHNSLISFDSVSSNQTRLSRIVGFDDFARDVAHQSLPQLPIVIPNLLNDAHNTTLAYGANWIRSFLVPLLQNSYFTNRTLILLTFDESETYDAPNRVGSVLLGGAVPSLVRGTEDPTFYTHYSMLSTLENNFGLPSLGRYDVGANVFSIVSNLTGYKNSQTFDSTRMSLNTSYPGYLNTQIQLAIPSPNPYLIGAGANIVLTISPHESGRVTTPYDGSGVLFDGEPGKNPKYTTVDSGNSKSRKTSLAAGPKDVVQGAVTVVTGNAPFHMITAHKAYRDVFFDAPLADLADMSAKWSGPDKLLDQAGANEFLVFTLLPPGHQRRIVSGGADSDENQSSESSRTAADKYSSENSYYALTLFKKSIGRILWSRPSPIHLDLIRSQIWGAYARGQRARCQDMPSWPVSPEKSSLAHLDLGRD